MAGATRPVMRVLVGVREPQQFLVTDAEGLAKPFTLAAILIGPWTREQADRIAAALNGDD